MGDNARLAWVFCFAAAAALAGQTLLLVEGQCRRLEMALSDDFRVVLFLRAPVDETRRSVIEEKLRAQSEIVHLRYISPKEALANLKREDPEMIDAIALVGENPLPAAFEVRPSNDALPQMAAWINMAQGLADWSDVRWKPAQLQAILRARLYAHWMRLTLSTLFCSSAALALWALFVSLKRRMRSHRFVWVGAFGGIAGQVFAAAITWPLRRDGVLWFWPAVWSQLAVIAACATLGWSLSLWHNDS